jgi:hypothetical protein
MQAELRSLFRKLRTPLTRFLYLDKQSFEDFVTLLLDEEDENSPDAKLVRLIMGARFLLSGVDIFRCPLLLARTIDDVNDRVLEAFASEEHEDSIGSDWNLGDPPSVSAGANP